MKKGRKQLQKATTKAVEEEDLDRFAGSSDEEDEEVEVTKNHQQDNDDDDDSHHDADAESYDSEAGNEDDNGVPDNDEYVNAHEGREGNREPVEKDDDESSIEGEGVDPAAKMASVMGRILGTTTTTTTKNKASTKSTGTMSVVLAKTVTPLQKLQQQEKEKQKAMKEKRKAMKERNLSALHYPLSIATTNTVNTEGRNTVAKELEQERFHRRVATRGVVALFNAISQHQRSSTEVSIYTSISNFLLILETCMYHSFLNVSFLKF
jgi:hypothetical protein